MLFAFATAPSRCAITPLEPSSSIEAFMQVSPVSSNPVSTTVTGGDARGPTTTSSSTSSEHAASTPRRGWQPLLSDKTREDLWTGATLTGFATIPCAGFMAVAMANDSGKMSPYLVRAQSLLMPYAFCCSTIVGLPAALIALPSALIVALAGETVGRLPIQR